MPASFTVRDLSGILIALPCFLIFLFAPGYVAGLWTDVLDFRSSSVKVRTVLAVPLSLCVSPILATLLAHVISSRGAALLFLVFPAVIAISAATEWKRLESQLRAPFRRSTWFTIVLVAAWVGVCLFSLPDFEIGQKLYSTTASFDHCVRTALISSSQRSGAPPANPFFYFHGQIPVRYYYYWNVLCALPASLSAVGPRCTLFASCIWSGFAVACLIPLWLREFCGDVCHLRRTSVIGIALLAVTGMDLLPTILDILAFHHPNGDMEWWEPNQVASWVDSGIWAPHHVAAMVACMASLLVLLDATKAAKVRRGFGIALGALGFASAGGLSVYVTLAFAAFVAVWILRSIALRAWQSFFVFVSASVGAMGISIPYLRELLARAGQVANNTSGASSPHFLTFAVRASHYLSPDSRSFSALPMQLIDMLLTYMLELGFYFFAGWIMMRLQLSREGRKRLTEAETACLYLLGASLLVTTFLQSSVIQNNDLGFRGILPVQFVLLLWGALLVEQLWFNHDGGTSMVCPSVSRLSRRFLLATLLLGALGSVYQVAMLRAFPILRDSDIVRNQNLFGQPVSGEIGADSYLIRSAYQELDARLPGNAIVQYNPETPAYRQMLAYHRFQSVDAFGSDCGTAFGGSLTLCQSVEAALAPLYQEHASEPLRLDDVDAICRALSIDVLLAQASDPVWQLKGSWVWMRKPVAANAYVRAIPCGGRPL